MSSSNLLKRIHLLKSLQLKLFLSYFKISSSSFQCDLTHHTVELQRFCQSMSLSYFNDLLESYHMKITQKSENVYELIPLLGFDISTEEEVDTVSLLKLFYKENIIHLSSEEFLELVHSLKNRIQHVLQQKLQHDGIQSIEFVLTGGEGYTGDFMLEYEINPAAAVTTIYWPDVTKFGDAHIDRFTLRKPDEVVDVSIFGFLTDFPHEVGHVLQNIYLQQIDHNCDDGWLAEHDPSVLSLNLLAESLKLSSLGDNHVILDEFSEVSCLLESCVLWLAKRTHHYHNHESITESNLMDYHQWKSSCGYHHPVSVGSASVAADYLKIRAALESYPLDLSQQLRALFVKRSQCSIRDDEYHPQLGDCHVRDAYFTPTSVVND